MTFDLILWGRLVNEIYSAIALILIQLIVKVMAYISKSNFSTLNQCLKSRLTLLTSVKFNSIKKIMMVQQSVILPCFYLPTTTPIRLQTELLGFWSLRTHSNPKLIHLTHHKPTTTTKLGFCLTTNPLRIQSWDFLSPRTHYEPEIDIFSSYEPTTKWNVFLTHTTNPLQYEKLVVS